MWCSVYVNLCYCRYMVCVEVSSTAEYTRQLVKQNDCVFTVLQGRDEEMELLCYDAHNCLLAILTQADTFMITNKIWCERFCLPDASCQYQYRLLTCSFTHCSVENGNCSSLSLPSGLVWGHGGVSPAGWGKGGVMWPSPWCHVRPTAITQRKWPSGIVRMARTSPLFGNVPWASPWFCSTL